MNFVAYNQPKCSCLPPQKEFQEDFCLETKKNDRIEEKEEQVGRGVSQDVVVSLLKKNSQKTFVRKTKKMIE